MVNHVTQSRIITSFAPLVFESARLITLFVLFVPRANEGVTVNVKRTEIIKEGKSLESKPQGGLVNRYEAYCLIDRASSKEKTKKLKRIKILN